MTSLELYPKTKLSYLRSIVEMEDTSISSSLENNYSTSTRNQRNPILTEIEYDVIVQLMCQYEPNSVFDYLKAHDQYNPTHCFPIVKKCPNLETAHSLLLEKTGDYFGSVGILLDLFRCHFSLLQSSALSVLVEENSQRIQQNEEEEEMMFFDVENRGTSTNGAYLSHRLDLYAPDQDYSHTEDDVAEEIKKTSKYIQMGIEVCERMSQKASSEAAGFYEVEKVVLVVLDTLFYSILECRKLWFSGVNFQKRIKSFFCF